MNFEAAFPLRFWINLGKREDRRHETEARLVEAGVTADRFAAVDATRIKNQVARGGNPEGKGAGGDAAATVRGYESAGRYALALTQRLAIREARRRGAPAVLLMEDDVVFHPNFQALVGAVELPED